MLSTGGVSGASLRADRDLLFQAICNLVDNAVKYTSVGSHITVSSLRNDGSITIAVTDDGEGIPVDYRDKVFDRFYRRESHRGTAGNGLGLSLVAAVAKLHGGQVFLKDNDPGVNAILDIPQ